MDRMAQQLKSDVKKIEGKYFFSVGRRKRAIATLRLYETGKGEIIINDKSLAEYFPQFELQNEITKPLKASGHYDSHTITVHVSGGGMRGQADSVQLAIARALILMDATLHQGLKKQDFLTRDPRKKERKKPGLKRARRAPQWSKR